MSPRCQTDQRVERFEKLYSYSAITYNSIDVLGCISKMFSVYVVYNWWKRLSKSPKHRQTRHISTLHHFSIYLFWEVSTKEQKTTQDQSRSPPAPPALKCRSTHMALSAHPARSFRSAPTSKSTMHLPYLPLHAPVMHSDTSTASAKGHISWNRATRPPMITQNAFDTALCFSPRR